MLAYRASTGQQRTLAASHPLDGGRVEYESASGALAVFDQGGTRRNPRLSLDQPPGASMGAPDDWLDGLVLTAAGAAARRRDLERAYGRAVGSAGRLTRHVRNREGATEDVLLDPVWGVPVEATLTRQGAREGRVSFEYGPTPSGNLVRRAIHSERVIDADGRRSVVTMKFSNVQVEGW